MKRKSSTSFAVADFLASAGEGRTLVKYGNKHKIFSQGDVADSIFFIQKGQVKITVVSREGKEAVLAILNKSEFCGEECLSDHTKRIATARAFGDCEIIRIEKKTFALVLDDEPLLSGFFLEYILKRTIRAEADLVDQLFNSSEKRLARALLMLASVGKDDPSDLFISKISQETLADMIGTTRSRVSFFMNKFRKMGLISYNTAISKGEGAPGLTIHSSLLSMVVGELHPNLNAEI